MYKKVLKAYRENLSNVDLLDKLYKSEGEKPNAIKNQQPHFIFSAENPVHSDKKKLDMGHEEALDFLKDRGYHAEEMQGKYGIPEKSIVVHNPPKHAVRHLMNLSAKLGQDSSIYSDGYNHEMHYHHGENAGMHHKGQGTDFHKKPPEDLYSSLNDTHFTHNFNFDELHEPKKSQLSISPEKMEKSERRDGSVYLKKNEDEHPFENPEPDTKLIHYSPKEGLDKLDPSRQGEGVKGTDFRAGKHKHPLTWFYGEGVKPEPNVTQQAKSKYVSSVGDKRLYDLAKDPEGIGKALKEMSKKRQVNPGIVDRDEYHDQIREAGYHGIYNSNLDPNMSKVVGMFEPMDVEAEHPIHPKDHEKTSAYNHHKNQERKMKAREFAEQEGHHNFNFLSKLKAKMGG